MTAGFTYVEWRRDRAAATAATGEPEVARWGTFRGAGGIGFYDDEMVTISAGDRPPGLVATGGVEVRPMTATARPDSTSPLSPGGVFALRHFALVDESVWDEFVELSVEAWPTFEADHGCHIEGLFRFTDAATDALLVTRYPSVAGWESSRTTIRPGDPAGKNFIRRRELTRRSVVRIAGSLVV